MLLTGVAICYYREDFGEKTIRVVTGPYFLATKIEVFYSRGKGDIMASYDMDDVITLFYGRPELGKEVRTAPEEIRDFISHTFREFLRNRDFLDVLPGHLFSDLATQQIIPLLMKRTRGIAEVYLQ